MVALVVFSITAMGIYSWINTGLISLQKVDAAVKRELVLGEAIERLKQIDLTASQFGELQLYDCDVHWQAETLEPWQPGLFHIGSPGVHDLGLYKVTLQVFEGQRLLGNYQFRQIQHKPVRLLEFEQ
jgi:hypothetical protein